MKVKRIDIIHHSHTDLGYTDHPEVVKELHKKYIDIALDAIAATAGNKPGERFCWTIEVLHPIRQWWQEASDSRKEALLKAIETGQLEVCGFAFNNTPFMNEEQWDKFFNWIPDDLWEKLKIRSGMQTDVNGVPLACAMRAYNKGIRYLWTGPNSYLGSVPFKQPSAFKWKMPEGGDIFVWVNAGYSNAHYLFNDNWRKGPVPAAADLRYRKPERGDIFPTGKDEILKAYERCIENIKMLVAEPGMRIENKQARQAENTQFSTSGGYEYEILPVSLTNQWRLDNDPPFLHITEFVAEWNAMGLKPEIRITTPTAVLKELEDEIGDGLCQYEGEWIDWWARGSISAPVDMAAARKAKRVLKSANSLPFRDYKHDGNMEIKVLEELCLFDEHTWGSWGSVAYPYSFDSRGQMAEKSSFAYRALALAEFMLAGKAREKFADAEDGIYITNTSDYSVSDWIVLPVDCLRRKYTYAKDCDTGEVRKIIFERGEENFIRPQSPDEFSRYNVSRTFSDNIVGRKARVWSGRIGPQSTKRIKLMEFGETAIQCNSVPDNDALEIKYDKNGWVSQVKWKQMTLPLFREGFGEFLSLSPEGFAPRWLIKDIFNIKEEAERRKKAEKLLRKENSKYENAQIIFDNNYMTVFEQCFSHSSLIWGKRTLEIWKDEPRARLKLTISRRSSTEPEVFFVKFPFGCKDAKVFISNGGHVFTPGEGQIPGTCMDYYAIDGWVHYKTDKGNWIWSAKDSPMINFGRPVFAEKISSLPGNMEDMYAMIFDNTWDTNFVADSNGVMEFTFDLAWIKDIGKGNKAEKIAESMSLDPVVLVKVR